MRDTTERTESFENKSPTSKKWSVAKMATLHLKGFLY